MLISSHILVGFLFLEESLQSKKKRERKDSDSNCERTSNKTITSLETEDSSSSLRSGDSGIELSSGMKMIDSDTNMQSEMDDDEVMTVESDIDADSDFEMINSDTELLIKQQCHENSNHLDGNEAHSYSSRFFKSSIPSCLVSQCGPRQCYGRVRNSLMDSYECVAVCVECLKDCANHRHSKRWTPVEVRGQAKAKLRKAGHSILNFFRLILDRRVFLSTLLYASLAFFTIMCNEVIVSEFLER